MESELTRIGDLLDSLRGLLLGVPVILSAVVNIHLVARLHRGPSWWRVLQYACAALCSVVALLFIGATFGHPVDWLWLVVGGVLALAALTWRNLVLSTRLRGRSGRD